MGGSKLYAGGPFTTVGDGSKVTGYFGIYDPSYVSALPTESAAPTALSLYPNPAPTTGQVRVTTDRPNCPLCIFDPLGRLVSQRTTDAAGEARLDVRVVALGLYFVRASATTRRLVVE